MGDEIHSAIDFYNRHPITAAIVLATGISQGGKAAGIASGSHKVAQVFFGCMVGLLVSWFMSKVWLVKPPPERDEEGELQATT